MSDMPYVYFVSYSYTRGFGAAEFRCEAPTTEWSDIDRFRIRIAEANGLRSNDVVVLNYQLLSGPDMCATCGSSHLPGGVER